MKKEIRTIIVEGPDCSGKDTLVERIKNKLRWDSKALHHKEGNQFQRYLQEYAFSEKTVFNRSHFSEKVYSTLWRGGNSFNEEEEKILKDLVLLNSIIIFVCPETEILKERYLSRKFSQQIKLNELDKSRKLFCQVFENMPCLLYFSESYDELNELVEKVCSIVEDSQ